VKVRVGSNQDGVARGKLTIAGGVHLRQRWLVATTTKKMYIDFYNVVDPDWFQCGSGYKDPDPAFFANAEPDLDPDTGF
jgi:hypothetical protein